MSTPLVRHCEDTYQGCCLPYKTPVTPNGWCTCICGDCRIVKYQAAQQQNELRLEHPQLKSLSEAQSERENA